jgi:predicted ABC-type transport system involved in lysophospholipase L1 biosynthesis ATPase subunit
MGSDRVGGDGVAIRAVEVRKVYGTKHAQVEALRGISIEIAGGERVALLGKSGSGKSTLLNLLGGLDRPSSGGLRVGGRDLHQLSGREMARFRSTTVGMIFQSFNLISSRSAVGNVELPMVFAGRSPRERLAAARGALEAVGLGSRLNHRPAQLSGGESQRVAIARALVNRPRVILADEPTGNLDSHTAQQVMALILDHVREHAATLILVTHDEELAASCTDRVVRLVDGRIASEGI